jgi:GTP diphosphokinase / guanosine-3',5'-bis(diphosphate) 3'-diphosphatase
MELDSIFNAQPRLTDAERKLIEKAYHFARKAHGEGLRKSGEPYITHPVAVAGILAELRMDAEVLAAAMLHDVVEDTIVTLPDIEREFGLGVARLVDGVTKVEQLPTDIQKTGRERNKEAEFLRKTFLAMGSDIRVILIKLADRLHNMRTLGYLSPERQRRMARETLEIFAPLANRLGIWQMKWELEDLSFRYINPDKYREIAREIDEKRIDRQDYLKRKTDQLRAKLNEYGVKEFQISGRPKHIYSIWRKMERKKVPFDQIYDVRAIRVIVPNMIACYQALGVVHDIWTPIREEFDDYIAAPKDNFYQSLHTAVRDDEGKVLEVQIRTPDMHEHAEYGVAAHWRYKEGVKYDEQFEKRVQHLRRMMEFGSEKDIADTADDYVELLKHDVLHEERIYVFTPKGDIIDLPAGATPIDFAYHIHSEVGDRCRGAKINGNLVNLDYRLKSGDRVEIITAKRGGPSLDWLSLSLGYTRTTRAQAKIRSYFRKQGREKNIVQGREVVERELKRLGHEKMQYDQLARMFNIQTDDFMAMVGYGDITAAQIVTRLEEQERALAKEAEERAAFAAMQQATTPPQAAPVNASDGISILGETGLLITLARCCSPTQGDPIVGFITRGKGVTVHRADCPNVINSSERDRFINVNWGRIGEKTYPVQVQIIAFDREGLLRDVGGVAADEHINFSNMSVNVNKNIATLLVTMEVENTSQLSRVLQRIEKIANVVEARRRQAG